MVAENFTNHGGASGVDPSDPLDSSDLFRMAAEANALETVGLERVLELFQDRLQTSAKRKARNDYFDVGQERFILERDRDGHVVSSRVDYMVQGVRIRSQNLKLSEWIATALQRYRDELGSQSLSREMLQRILGIQ